MIDRLDRRNRKKRNRMRVARLLLCYVLLEDYSTNLGGATITSDAARQDASATNPTLSEETRGDFLELSND
ncbi:lachesin isoform X1 [Apis mellifera carnica]|nr:lachesin isoform X1 [Apis mellifera carnica]